MIRAKILKNNVVTNSAKFLNQQLAEAWVAQESANGSFGKNQRWLTAAGVSSEGLDVNDALATREIGDGEEAYTEYEFPAEYTVEYVNIAAEVAAEARFVSKQKDIEFGNKLLTEIMAMSSAKELPDNVVDQLFDSPLLGKLERMLKTGSIETFKRALENNDVSSLFSNEEKTLILAKVNIYLGV